MSPTAFFEVLFPPADFAVTHSPSGDWSSVRLIVFGDERTVVLSRERIDQIRGEYSDHLRQHVILGIHAEAEYEFESGSRAGHEPIILA
jgi:hypothetical protein